MHGQATARFVAIVAGFRTAIGTPQAHSSPRGSSGTPCRQRHCAKSAMSSLCPASCRMERPHSN